MILSMRLSYTQQDNIVWVCMLSSCFDCNAGTWTYAEQTENHSLLRTRPLFAQCAMTTHKHPSCEAREWWTPRTTCIRIYIDWTARHPSVYIWKLQNCVGKNCTDSTFQPHHPVEWNFPFFAFWAEKKEIHSLEKTEYMCTNPVEWCFSLCILKIILPKVSECNGTRIRCGFDKSGIIINKLYVCIRGERYIAAYANCTVVCARASERYRW